MENNQSTTPFSVLEIFEIVNSLGRLKMLTQKMALLISYLHFRTENESQTKVNFASFKESFEFFKNEWNFIVQKTEEYIKNNKRIHFLVYDDGKTKVASLMEVIKKMINNLENGEKISSNEFENTSKKLMVEIPNLLNEINTQFYQEGKNTVELDEKNYQLTQKDILKTLKSITEIASSARMISFNAHIIAERAGGDIGKEFSVVAEGISKLTTRINDLVDKALEIIEIDQ
ncbi:MAG: methyl-accepting chemotaxis protein [Bdellovibrionales bacterium]|nr:methyl-accepting chemotaxis protein [Bdellovibrionales bacterium]